MREPFLRLFITKGLPEPSKFKQAHKKRLHAFFVRLCFGKRVKNFLEK